MTNGRGRNAPDAMRDRPFGTAAGGLAPRTDPFRGPAPAG
jgi:hypothetical protein